MRNLYIMQGTLQNIQEAKSVALNFPFISPQKVCCEIKVRYPMFKIIFQLTEPTTQQSKIYLTAQY